ncbi:MAG TPA: hypothetical protein VFO70_07140, partial [Chitinophagaceae bacterium]|nr:hypothetical protein [Chitinophagaceae bacterium]
LEGSDYPNGGLSGKTVAFSNDSLLTITSSIRAHWRINFTPRIKSAHLANFKNNYINHVSDTIEIKTNLFSYENQSPAIIENSGSTTTIQLSVEFSFNKKTRRGKIRIWKNGTLMTDQLLFFAEPSLEIKSGQVLKMPV